ncbi:MAG: BatD family protein [Gemmatimonadetes bacterium]|nr:BatD family protein [Gemmatimonadota bacterium]
MNRLRGPAALVVVVASLALAPAASRAQDVAARAFLDRARVEVGRALVLNVEISGTQRFDQEPELPDVSAFAELLGSSTQTSMRIVNGESTVSLTVRYTFRATREGTFEIGPVMVRAEGRTLTTEPVSIVISADPGSTPGGAGGSAGGAGDDGTIAPGDLFVLAEPNKRRVRENEPIIVEYRIYTRRNVSTYGITELPAAAGFWVEEFELPPQPQVEQVVREGVAYATAVIRKVAMYPTGPGEKTLEPLGIEAQVRVRRRSRDRFDDIFGGLFDRSSLFDDVVTASAASPPIEIEVLPLPSSGRPAGFSGLVGDLAVSSSVDRDSVATNEAVTLRVEVSGSGNLKALAPPDLQFPPTVEAFPPEVTERLSTSDRGVTGSRTYEYVLIPRAPGTLTIPGVDVGYFDIASDGYRTASAPALDLRVTGRAAEGVRTGASARAGVEELRTDIRFIRIEPPRFRRAGRSLFQAAWFWIVLLVPVGAIGGAAGFRRRRGKLLGDRAYARDRGAARIAKKRLAKAGELATGDDGRGFYAEAARALEGFAADKLDTSAAGLRREELGSALAARGASHDTIEAYLDLLETCDRRRFAPGADDSGERAAFLERAASALAVLAGELAR